MKCSKVKRLLSDYVARVATPQQAAQVQEHVRVCTDCAAELGDLERIVRAAAVQGERAAPRDCWPAVRERLMARDFVARGLALRKRWGTILTGAAAAAAIAAAVVLRFPVQQATGPTVVQIRPHPVASQMGVESEYLQAYVASRDGRLLASDDSVALLSVQAGNSD
jgi:anti-sigma-K factor RskA